MPTKRIILMYITELSGHHKAALSIEKAIRILEPATEVLTINAFQYTNPITEKIIDRIYIAVIKRAPQIWNYMYDNPKVMQKLSWIKEKVHKFNSPKLKALFDNFKPDAVLCTQAFPCGMVADFKKAFNVKLPLVAVLTDYVPHSYWIYDQVDYYVAPCVEVAERLNAKGVPIGKIKPLGIPFDPKFNDAPSRDEILRRLGFSPGIFTVLIMGGGQGLGPIPAIIESLEELEGDLQEIIVTGSNKKLYKKLSRKAGSFKKRVKVFGYADNVHELMSISNVVITKPGGITTVEAMSKNLPMIIVRPIPGQEANNTSFLTSKGAALRVDKGEDILGVIRELISNPQKLTDLSKAAAGISKPNSSLDIARLVLDLCHV